MHLLNYFIFNIFYHIIEKLTTPYLTFHFITSTLILSQSLPSFIYPLKKLDKFLYWTKKILKYIN